MTALPDRHVAPGETNDAADRPARAPSTADAARDDYYGLPTIHSPHWKWEIITYFFLGGIASASYAVASAASIAGGAEGRRIARAGYYLSLATIIPCPVLLILDLKRPSRFLNMLRVVKLRSPMSLGTWGLVTFSAFSALSALHQAAEDGLLRRAPALERPLRAVPARPLGAVGSIPGIFVGGYTGVLLAATAVPLWAKGYRLLGPLFLTSALSNATAAITLILAPLRGTDDRLLKRLERLELVTLLAEGALTLALRAQLGPTIARPLEEGRLGLLHRVGVLGAGQALPLALGAKSALSGGTPSRLVACVSALLTLAGGVLFRYTMVAAGKASADDPAATFELAHGPRRGT